MKPIYVVAKYAGIITGALYGLLMRMLFNIPGNHIKFTDLFSITFIWIVPIVIGIIPMLFANKDQLSSAGYRIITPLLSVLLFFILCFATRIEDLLCIMIIAAPFLICASIGGSLFGTYLKNYRERKGILYSVLLVPLLAGFIEEQTYTSFTDFEVKTSTIIDASPEKIFNNVIRVSKINKNEYTKGFFNYAGIPQPLYAQLNSDTLGGIRTGYFEGGLRFEETVTQWNRNERIAFKIKVIPSSVRKTVFDQHILKGNHFRFLNASYQIKKIGKNKCQLILASSYKLNTNVNRYASFWGNALLADFQERLLVVIKNRCDGGLKN